MPVSFSFPSTSAYFIEKHFKNGTTESSLYTVMAHLLQEDALCFFLCLLGTDSKFSAQQELNRWDFTVAKLEKEGMKVTFARSHGD